MTEQESRTAMADLSLETRANVSVTPSLPPPVVDPISSRPGRSSSRESGNHSRSSSRGHSRRSRSSGSRSRSQHRHSSNRHQSRRSYRTYFRHKERNFAAATSSTVAIVLLCIALVPDWIYLKGGGCHILHSAKSLHHLSTAQFFYGGHFYHSHPFTKAGDSIYHFSASSNDIMVNCVTYTVVLLFKACIAFTLIAVCCSLVSFILNLIGPEYHLLLILRRNAIFNILTVILCVSINLFCYWITTAVESLQKATQIHAGSKIEVSFDASFYLITAAGCVSVMAVACNCLRRHSLYSTSRESPRTQDQLLYDDDTEALLSAVSRENLTPVSDYPPPPVYTP